MTNQETLLNIILDNISDATITIDAKGIVHSVNSTVEEMFGYSTSELIGSNVNMLMTEPYHEMHDSYLKNYLTSGQTKIIGQSREVTAQRKNGEIFEIELFVHDIGVDTEHRFLGIIRDISERARIDKMKSEFVSTVSHELRTPLTSIKGALGMINSGVLGVLPDKAKRMVELAHNNTERLILLVNDLLDMEKIQAGKIDLKMEKISLTATIKESIAMNQTYASNLKVKLVLQGAPEDYFILADSNRILQVMANLISNAAKYSPPNDEVQVTIIADESFVQVSVTDHGLGIPPEYHTKIFQKFSQLDASDSRQKGGTGLGLNITKAIVEHHGGRIDFVSEVGKGATFFFKLPLWQPTQKINPVIITNTILPKKIAGHVLVLEDEPDIAKLLALMLEQQKFQVTTCGSAAQAKQLLQSEKFDLMTVDIRLPDQDGLSLIRELRGQEETKQLPIIIISAEAGMAKKNNVTSGLRVIDWIEKPINQTRLLDSIKSSIKKTEKVSKILYLEDDADLTDMMATLLSDNMLVVAARTLAQAKQLLTEQHFDLVILDVGLPDGSGIEILPLLHEQLSLIPVIIFSGESITAEVVNKVDAALIKSQVSNEELIRTITNLLGGTQK